MIINLIRERNYPDDKNTWVDSFEYDGFHGDAEEAMRAAVKEYLSTEDGKGAIKNTGCDFNWGDAVVCVPAEIWEKYGLFPLSNDTKDVVVNQDEVLCKSEKEAEE